MAATKKRRRSQEWFGREGKMGFIYRSWVKNRGIPHDQFDGRPVIGICNTYSELTPCNSHFRTIAEQVKIGVWESGGFPLEFPVMSLGVGVADADDRLTFELVVWNAAILGPTAIDEAVDVFAAEPFLAAEFLLCHVSCPFLLNDRSPD